MIVPNSNTTGVGSACTPPSQKTRSGKEQDRSRSPATRAFRMQAIVKPVTTPVVDNSANTSGEQLAPSITSAHMMREATEMVLPTRIYSQGGSVTPSTRFHSPAASPSPTAFRSALASPRNSQSLDSARGPPMSMGSLPLVPQNSNNKTKRNASEASACAAADEKDKRIEELLAKLAAV